MSDPARVLGAVSLLALSGCAGWECGRASDVAFQDRAPFRSDSTLVGRNVHVPRGGSGILRPEPGELSLVTEATTFVNELGTGGHGDDALDGETLIGFYAPVRARFAASDSVSIEAGATLGRNYGDDESLDVTEPLLRFVYEPKEDLAFIAGSIFPTHRMHEALLDDEVRLRDPVEEGLQVRYDGERLQQDFWLDWRVREERDRREIFDVGNVTRVRTGPLWWDAQMLWFHAGGQRNEVSGVEDNISLLGGASIPLELREDRSEITPRLAYLSTTEDGDAGDFDGDGVEGRLEWRERFSSRTGLELFASYYVGEDLQTRRGDPLYRLDSDAQLGARFHHLAPGGLRIDLEARLSVAESEPDYRFMIFFSWGQAFSLWNALTGQEGV